MKQPLHQIQVLFSQEEDRLQLCISTSTHEVRCWLTRRFVKLLWPVLRRAMETTVGSVVDTPVTTSRIPARDTPSKQGHAPHDTANPFLGDAKEMPLGPLPILLTRAHLEPLPDGKFQVGLHPQESNGIEMAIEPKHLYALGKLLVDAVAKADWDLALSIPVDTEESGPKSGLFCQVESNYKFN
ncbi:MAG: hypothetical protein HQL90_01675 [Magnetococcales bacterium]|nr:hypothetical protein [Magnetococcales bacterium]